MADSDNHRVQVLNSDLNFSSSFGKKGNGKGQFDVVHGIACDSTGKVYVTDIGNHRVQVFTAKGQFCMMFGKYGKGLGELYYPSGIAIDRDDLVYVSETNNNRISVFTSKGQFVRLFGHHGSEPGEFKSPRGVAVDSSGVVASYMCVTGLIIVFNYSNVLHQLIALFYNYRNQSFVHMHIYTFLEYHYLFHI